MKKNIKAFFITYLFLSLTSALGHGMKNNSLAESKQQHALAIKFSEYFSNRDANGIGTLLDNNFSLYEPGLVTKGKNAVIKLFKTQFQKNKESSYRILHLYQDGNTTILEFKITLDNAIYNGIDIIEWKNDKMSELRCYYNPPGKLTT